MGESFGAWQMGSDDALLGIIGSANIACGFHAGDPLVMQQTIRAAGEYKVSLGAHPSYPDLQGFGRRRMDIPPTELTAILIYQIGAAQALARAQGQEITHVKPHGALSNMASADAKLADVVASAIAMLDKKLILLAPACSQLALAGERAGIPVALEIFGDRRYLDDGQLQPRQIHGAVIHDANESLAHVQSMLEAGGIVSCTGKILKTDIHSICVHGDGAEAVNTASKLREGLIRLGYQLVSIPEVLAL